MVYYSFRDKNGPGDCFPFLFVKQAYKREAIARVPA